MEATITEISKTHALHDGQVKTLLVGVKDELVNNETYEQLENESQNIMLTNSLQEQKKMPIISKRKTRRSSTMSKTERGSNSIVSAQEYKADERKKDEKVLSWQDVAFSAYLGNDIQNITTNNTIKCDQILTNSGNSYNEETGRFTSPNNGSYYLTFNFKYSGRLGFLTVNMIAGGRKITRATVFSGYLYTSPHMAGNTALVALRPDELVWLEVASYVYGAQLSITTDVTKFSALFLF